MAGALRSDLPPSGTLAFLFTDIEGSTRLLRLDVSTLPTSRRLRGRVTPVARTPMQLMDPRAEPASVVDWGEEDEIGREPRDGQYGHD